MKRRGQKYPYLKDEKILLASEVALKELKEKFGSTEKYEKLVQVFLFGYFLGKGLKMQMEYKPFPQYLRESIDFRYFDKNQALLELATIRNRKMKKRHSWEHLPSVNTSELRKLMHAPAKKKILLILDFHDGRIDFGELAKSYFNKWRKIRREKRWKGKIVNLSVMYVHYDGRKCTIPLSIATKAPRFRDLSDIKPSAMLRN